RAHRVAGVEFVVAPILELLRPAGEGLGREAWLAVQAFGGEADERVALDGAIDGGKRLAPPLQRPLRVGLAGSGRPPPRIADHIARRNDRQRLAVLVHRTEPARGEDGAVEPL